MEITDGCQSDDFSKYETMKQSGDSAEHVCLEAFRDKLDPITVFRLIRVVFALTPRQAQEVMLRTDAAINPVNQ